MQPRRIVLANRPRLLREMLKRVIEKTPDLLVVGEVTDLPRSVAVVEQTDAEWLIISPTPDGRIPDIVETLLSTHPSISILSLATDGSQVRLKWIDAREEILDRVSLNELIAVLRRGTGPRNGRSRD